MDLAIIKEYGLSVDLAIIKEYGLSVFILIGAAKGLQVLYKNMREDMKENKKNCKEMLDSIQESNEVREKAIIEAMKEQSETLRNINCSITTTNSEISIIKKVLEGLRNKEAS